MTREVGIYEAKTQLPRLISEVERGESVTITRHGRPVARIVPVEKPAMSVGEAIAAMEAFRERHPLGDLTIKEMIEEGRRH